MFVQVPPLAQVTSLHVNNESIREIYKIKSIRYFFKRIQMVKWLLEQTPQVFGQAMFMLIPFKVAPVLQDDAY